VPPYSPGLTALCDLMNTILDQAMSLAVHARRDLGVGRLDGAKHLVGLLMDPVLEVLHAVGTLLRQVCLVRVGDVIGGRYFLALLHHA
jgi:hypothetical protein